MMKPRVAVLTFEGFNELDSFIASALLNRAGLDARIVAPDETVRSMNGVVVMRQAELEWAQSADAVLVGSGTRTREIVRDEALMQRLHLDPARQLVGAQCSGALVLARFGLLDAMPACTDTTTRPWLEETGVTVLEQPFFADGNIATAGGCLSSQYLAAWVVARLRGIDAALSLVHYVAPVGQKQEYAARTAEAILRFLPPDGPDAHVRRASGALAG